MEARRIAPARLAPDLSMRAVPSKSDTHRALVAAALACGASTIVAPLDADDTRRTRDGLRHLGFDIEEDDDRWIVRGQDGRVPGGGAIDLGGSGTTCRLLVAVAAVGAKPTCLDGNARLRKRPLAPLVAALEELGALVEVDPVTRGLPVLAGGRSIRGGHVEIAAAQSSQFASALLMLGPVLPDGLRVVIRPPVVSLPYVAMTVRTMIAFGARVDRLGALAHAVSPGGYGATSYVVEGDHSSASYFLAVPAVLGAGRVRIAGLRADSPQPDAVLSAHLRALGLRVRLVADEIDVEAVGPPLPYDLDFSDAPDLVPTMAVIAAFSRGPSRLRGIGHLRGKESDRVATVAENLERIGARARVTEDELVIEPASGRPPVSATITTASDHRIAMAFAMAGLRLSGVVIDDADCVGKSYPRFWHDFARLESAPA